VQVKLLDGAGELYVLAQSLDRVNKERAMRRRQLKKLWARLKEIHDMKLKRDDLLIKLGGARQQSPAAWRLVKLQLPDANGQWSYALGKDKLRQVRRREGRYLLRSNLTGRDPGQLWQFYVQLVAVEEAFKNLKDDLNLRPLYHQKQQRVEAHIFVAFLAYCLHVTLRGRLRPLAPGLTPRAVLDKFAAIQMIDVHFPTTDGRELLFRRYTQPEKDQKMLLAQLGWELPPQAPPQITAKGEVNVD
jgi:transposase